MPHCGAVALSSRLPAGLCSGCLYGASVNAYEANRGHFTSDDTLPPWAVQGAACRRLSRPGREPKRNPKTAPPWYKYTYSNKGVDRATIQRVEFPRHESGPINEKSPVLKGVVSLLSGGAGPDSKRGVTRNEQGRYYQARMGPSTLRRALRRWGQADLTSNQ